MPDYKPIHFTANEQSIIFKAIQFVAEKHAGHWRKGTNIPYITHLMNVMKILCEHHCPADVVVAGILHDTIEDTAVEVEEIASIFGEEITRLVAAASEPDKWQAAADRNSENEAPWRERKQKTIDHIMHETNPKYLLVSAADKLDNIRAIAADYAALGETFWGRFNAAKTDQQWYYSSLANAFVQQGLVVGDPLKSIGQEIKKLVETIWQADLKKTFINI